jgi:hypothetical protein
MTISIVASSNYHSTVLKKEKQLLERPRNFVAVTSLNRLNAESLLAYRESRARERRNASYLNMEMG